MKRNKGTFGMLMLLFLTMLIPLSVNMIINSPPSITIELELTAVQTSQDYPDNVVINEILFNDVIPDDKGEFIVYAPYGLNDLFGMIVRPNKVQITKEIYLNKVERWAKIWHKLKIIPWDCG